MHSQFRNREIARVFHFISVNYRLFRDEFLKVNKKKLDSLFDHFHKIVQYNYNNSVLILNQCKKEQIDQVGLKLVK